MALKKEIILDNGIILDYHRIITLQLVTNKYINITTLSYINEETRNEDVLDDKVIITNVYTIENYEEDYNIKRAYEYLKTLPEFENSEDV